MNNVLNVKEKDKLIYNIYLEPNYDSLECVLRPFNMNDQQICIVTDSNVAKVYLDEVKRILTKCCKSVSFYIFTAGEENKTLDTVKEIYKHLINHKFQRKDMLVALGGGVVGDMTGYASATFLRGIRFIQMPTSLLSMVDSSIGGKTGVDFDSYKNMVGAFHQPQAVYINLAALNSLDEQQFSSGMGEIIKHGYIKNKAYFNWLKNNKESIMKKDITVLNEMIYESCKIKRDVVERDPKEQGERALLNFGHTLGHAIEKLMNFTLLHGECVGLGMIAANYISYKRNYLAKEDLEDTVQILSDFHLTTKINAVNEEQLMDAVKHDKKMDAGTIKFILLNKIGEAVIDKTVTDEEMKEAVRFITK